MNMLAADAHHWRETCTIYATVMIIRRHQRIRAMSSW